MAYSPKDYIILCIDVGPSMSLSPPTGGDTYLEMSLRIANQIVQQKMFAGSKDFVGLVLFGTSDTENELATHQGGYDNISVTHLPANPTLDFLKFLNEIKPGDVSADFIDAIVVSMDCVVKATSNIKRVGEKKIYLLTDGGSEYSDDGLDQICAGLQKENVELIVVGPNIQASPSSDGDSDGGHPGDGPGPSHFPRAPPPSSSSLMKKTPQQAAGEAVLQRVIEAVDGVCFSFNEALQVSSLIRKSAKKQVSRFTGNLEIGNQLNIPCKIYTKTMEERPASWKKLSAISQASANPGSMAVKMQRSYHLNDEDETEVEIENVAKGYRYGKSLIPISDADEKAMKMESPRCLSLLGFTKRSSIKWHQIIGSGAQVVVANPSDQSGCVAMSAFTRALYETNMVMVCRYVWRNNSQPKLMILIPRIKSDHECLMMLQLPFMEDIRQFVFASLPGENKSMQPTAEQLAAVDDLISSMDLMTADVDEDGNPCEALKPKRTCNPLIQRSFQCITHRALHPDKPLPEIDPSVKRILQPNEAILPQCSGSLTRIKELFPMVKVEKKKADEETANVWKKTSDLDLDAEAPPAKKSRVEDETDFSMASLAKGEVTQVGTLDPVGDYNSLLSKQGISIFSDASKQLQQVTLKLVKESFGDTYYSKAMDCVQMLRTESIKHAKPETFNNFLRELKDDLIGTRYSVFWDKVKGEGVTLVSSEECPESSVTSDQAKQFIEADAMVMESTPPQRDDTEDADDLLAMM